MSFHWACYIYPLEAIRYVILTGNKGGSITHIHAVVNNSTYWHEYEAKTHSIANIYWFRYSLLQVQSLQEYTETYSLARNCSSRHVTVMQSTTKQASLMILQAVKQYCLHIYTKSLFSILLVRKSKSSWSCMLWQVC